jgi:hypothetical protein
VGGWVLGVGLVVAARMCDHSDGGDDLTAKEGKSRQT